MKKLICIVLIGWLPVFMVTANAMSFQMTIQEVSKATVPAEVVPPCHDTSNQPQEVAHQCIGCGFCMMASSMANFNTIPTIAIPALTSDAPESVDVVFQSTNYSPAFRPPILN
jgi:formate hydrogenlyase subunit 6/NADH:ubiquinone oxidoreductase subunit I